MKSVAYSPDALDALDRHSNMSGRIRRAVDDYASGSGARAGQVKALLGTPLSRLRVGDFRVIFRETADLIYVVRIGPRGDVYD